MQRYNIFNQIHKGLRTMLYETSIALQQTDFSNADEAEQSLEKMNEVLVLLDKHANSEDSYVFYAIRPYEPSVVDAFEQEHIKDHDLSQKLSGLCTVYTYTVSPDERKEVGESICKAFVEFMIFNLQHMANEENTINTALWRYFNDEEIKAIEYKIVANMSDNAMAAYSKWMMRGLNNAEIITWLRTAERKAPEYVFQSLFTTAEKELSELRFREVLEGLTEGVMLV